MVNGLWGKKIGMTQVFTAENKVVPVTVIDVSNWYITQIKTKENDGYDAIQVGYIKPRFSGKEFTQEWISAPKKHFGFLREIRLADTVEGLTIGQITNLDSVLSNGDYVDVWGVTKGAGFAGAMRRHNFSGGRGSHGAKLGRAPGSLGFMRSEGKVIKGKKLPGHMGVDSRVMQNLKVIKTESAAGVVLIKGTIPGKAGSLVFVKKSR